MQNDIQSLKNFIRVFSGIVELLRNVSRGPTLRLETHVRNSNRDLMKFLIFKILQLNVFIQLRE